MTRRESLLATLVLSALAALTACGSSPSAPTPPPGVTPPTVDPQPPTPVTPPTLGVTRILAFGDSMTEGVVSPPMTLTPDNWHLPLNPGRSNSYPFKLHAALAARYTAQTISVFNGGIAGNQARDDRGRFSQALSEGKPELVLLMEGTNDLNGVLDPGEGINARVTAVVAALEDFVRDASFRNIPVMIATLPPQRPGGPKAWGIEYLPRFNAAVKEMAAKKGAQVVDIAQLPLSSIGADGLHPTEEGYQRIAEMWLDAIKSRYEKTLQ